MSCTFSAPLTEEQIIAALDSDVPPDVAAHLRDCPECRARFEAEQAFEGGLMQRLFRVNCPTLDKLRDYAFGMLSADAENSIEQHLQRCPHCRSDLDSMKSFSEQMVGQPDVPAPNPSPLPKWPLVPPDALFGKQDASGASGFRGGSRGDVKGVMLEAEGASIALQTEQHDDNSVTISGDFILSEEDYPKWTDALVEIWQDGQLKRFTTVDDVGSFVCVIDSNQAIRLVIMNRDEQVLVFDDIQFPKQYGH